MRYHIHNFSKFLSIFVFCFSCSIVTMAQSRFTISGKVVDDKGSPAQSATVFLSGTQDVTTTNNKGEFIFSKLEPGAYKVIIKYADYRPITKNIPLQKDTALSVNTSLKFSAPQLDPRETLVGRAKKLEIFRTNFLGQSDLAISCKIVNPEVLFLVDNTKTDKLEVTSNEFLIIENRELGYTIKYLLKALVYDYYERIAKFDGDAYFEEMVGTDEIKQLWRNNRAAAYRGSMMHFFRSVYQGPDEPMKQGFLVQRFASNKVNSSLSFATGSLRVMASVLPRPMGFDSVVTAVDDIFISVRFKDPIAVTYNPQKTAKAGKLPLQEQKAEKIVFSTNVSGIQSASSDAFVDSRGSFIESYPFALLGHWDRLRIGDILPYNYVPDN